MDFAPNEDQIALNSALDKLAAQFSSPPTDFRAFALSDENLEAQLSEGGFFEAAAIPELGPVSAAMMIERLARLPYCSESALSMLLQHQLGEQWPRPYAIVENGNPGRFVAQANTLIIIDGEKVGLAKASPEITESVESLYAYPMGKLNQSLVFTPLPEAQAENIQIVCVWLSAPLWIPVLLAASRLFRPLGQRESTFGHFVLSLRVMG